MYLDKQFQICKQFLHIPPEARNSNGGGGGGWSSEILFLGWTNERQTNSITVQLEGEGRLDKTEADVDT